MNIETGKTQLNKNDILAAFGDRVLMERREKQKREYLDLDQNLTSQALVPQNITSKYEAIGIDDCLMGDPELVHSPRSKPLYVKLLKAEPNPVSLIVNKIYRWSRVVLWSIFLIIN